MVEESKTARFFAWWPVAALVLVGIGFVAMYLQLGTAIRETRTLQTDIVAMHERLVALEETTSQLRLDQIGAQMRSSSARPPRQRPIPGADGQPGGGQKAKAGKAKAGKGKAKAESAEGAAPGAKAGKSKAKSKSGKGKARGPAGG